MPSRASSSVDKHVFMATWLKWWTVVAISGLTQGFCSGAVIGWVQVYYSEIKFVSVSAP